MRQWWSEWNSVFEEPQLPKNGHAGSDLIWQVLYKKNQNPPDLIQNFCFHLLWQILHYDYLRPDIFWQITLLHNRSSRTCQTKFGFQNKIYFNTQHILKHFFWTNLKWMFNEGFWVSLQIVRCFRPRTDIFFCFAYNFVFIICHLKFVKSHCQIQIVFLKNSILFLPVLVILHQPYWDFDLFTYKLLFTCDI